MKLPLVGTLMSSGATRYLGSCEVDYLVGPIWANTNYCIRKMYGWQFEDIT